MDIEPREVEAVLKAYFKQGPNGPLSSFPSKFKKQIIVLRHLAQMFEEGRNYTEKEINAALMERYSDFPLLRRGMVDCGCLGREPDGSRYWVRR